VAGVGGDIVLGPGAVAIDAAGEVSQGMGAEARVLGRLQLVAFADTASMQSLGEGLLSAGGGARPLEAHEAGVRQGWLENANVSTATEMAALMQAMRQAESLQKATQAWDDMQGLAIRRLGELS
jgi:flagellar basal body rod protein FlgG